MRTVFRLIKECYQCVEIVSETELSYHEVGVRKSRTVYEFDVQ